MGVPERRTWATAFAVACADLGLDRTGRLALIHHAIGREVTSSLKVRPGEQQACWRTLIDYQHWRIELAVDGDKVRVLERPAC